MSLGLLPPHYQAPARLEADKSLGLCLGMMLI
jgi:hypothetical protein